MQAMPADTVPDSKCPICLDTFDNAVYLDPCCHVYCFLCIQKWSKCKRNCPICQKRYFFLYRVKNAEDDTSEDSESRCVINFDQSRISLIESPVDFKAWKQYENYSSSTPLHNEGSNLASEIPASFSYEGNSQGLQWTSSDYSADLLPQHDETPGPLYSHSEEHSASMVSELERCTESSVWERAIMQSSVNSSNSLSEHHDISGQVNLYTERTPELIELSSDSEDSIREEKREDVKKEQSIQDISWSDRELSRASLPQSPHTSGYQFKKRLAKSGDGSKHQSKRRRRLVSRDTCLSPTGQTESSNCESTSSSDSGRSWSYNKSSDQSSSSNLDSNRCYRRSYHQTSYLSQRPKTSGDGTSCSKSSQSEAHCSSMSPGQEFRIQTLTERTDLQSQMEFHERHDSHYEQSSSRSPSPRPRSRSPSEETDRTRCEKPVGKRKCKTRHLEDAE
ncbi:uncharacterized protein [Excalfactoria chinensis]|uniref:uncharacterized protein n=1 Tax=Excalfactoria chinensis TaxID=46218 RepID=UPI003B3B4DA5